MSPAVTAHEVIGPGESTNHVSQLGHFDLGPTTEVPSAEVLSPGTSLYGFDPQHDRAIFVQVDPTIDLTAEPFLYEAQRRHARRVLLVPFAELVGITTDLPDADRPVLIFSVGRCGSTLLGQALAELATAEQPIITLSEPDTVTHAVGMRDPSGIDDEELIMLLRAAGRSLQHSFGNTAGSRLVIKFRGWTTQVADLVTAALPDSRPLFLTRRFEPWLQSMHRYQRLDDTERDAGFAAAVTDGLPDKMGYPGDRFLPIVARSGLPTSRLQQTVLTWVSLTEAYLRDHTAGRMSLALDYDTLCAEPVAALSTLSAALGLPAPLDVPTAFGRDSQAGSRMSGVALRRTVPDLDAVRVAEATTAVADLGLDPNLGDLPGLLVAGEPHAAERS